MPQPVTLSEAHSAESKGLYLQQRELFRLASLAQHDGLGHAPLQARNAAAVPVGTTHVITRGAPAPVDEAARIRVYRAFRPVCRLARLHLRHPENNVFG